jgi:hypothetical protein
VCVEFFIFLFYGFDLNFTVSEIQSPRWTSTECCRCTICCISATASYRGMSCHVMSCNTHHCMISDLCVFKCSLTPLVNFPDMKGCCRSEAISDRVELTTFSYYYFIDMIFSFCRILSHIELYFINHVSLKNVLLVVERVQL